MLTDGGRNGLGRGFWFGFSAAGKKGVRRGRILGLVMGRCTPCAGQSRAAADRRLCRGAEKDTGLVAAAAEAVA